MHDRSFPFFFDACLQQHVPKFVSFSVVGPCHLSFLLRPVPFPSSPLFETGSNPLGPSWDKENVHHVRDTHIRCSPSTFARRLMHQDASKWPLFASKATRGWWNVPRFLLLSGRSTRMRCSVAERNRNFENEQNQCTCNVFTPPRRCMALLDRFLVGQEDEYMLVA